MRNIRTEVSWLALMLPLFAGTDHAQTPSSAVISDLGGTSWQLVEFQGSDDAKLVPDERSKYTIAFDRDGGVSVRADCNRGHGSWSSAGPQKIQFSPMALTRAICPPSPLNDRFVRDWEYIRSYTLKDGHLFLSLMVDGGIYEYEPMNSQGSTSARIKGMAMYRERMALPAGSVFDATLEDVSRAGAAATIVGRTRIEHPGNPPIPFEIAFDPAEINDKNTYVVRARITASNGQLIFTTTQSYMVLTGGHGKEVKMLLQKAGAEAVSSESALRDLPATFAGTLPCADCPGIQYRISIHPDRTFSSHMVYEERNASFSDSGKWELMDNGQVLVLHGSRNVTDKFAIRDSDTLRKLDMNGHEIDSKLNYDLKREPASAVTERSGTAAQLENTHWSLIRLGESSLSSDPHRNEAYFILDPSTHRVSGSGGCNRLMGSYKVDGDHLKFSKMAGSMMMCIQGMETEQDFLQALPQVDTWKVDDRSLELFDTSGKSLARFEARASE